MRRWALRPTSRSLGWLFFAVVACGGGNKEAADPSDVDSESTEPVGASDRSRDPGDDTSNVRNSAGTPDAKGGPPPPSATQSADDATAVLELVVNDPELEPYLRLGEPGRFPLKIAGSKLPAELKLVKNNEPVQIVSGPKDKKDPVLVFTEVEVAGKKASVRYRYDIEGIRGSANLTKGQYGWELTNSRVIENK